MSAQVCHQIPVDTWCHPCHDDDMTTTPAHIRNTQPGTLPVGTMTHLGLIDQVSLTAYRIAGRWVSYDQIHGRPAGLVEPLITLG